MMKHALYQPPPGHALERCRRTHLGRIVTGDQSAFFGREKGLTLTLQRPFACRDPGEKESQTNQGLCFVAHLLAGEKRKNKKIA
ncbi:hypothetical protein [Rhizobium rhizosphaerae]|uniref:hypothetical protein n=1 Tax=Xaviernesmea rhizosphaerae TaxID=1672749 RepID=UPI00111B7D00|nr:hypothetical protein [Xaviernesmea rhizosphaerae]